jgi:hypothetical protein
MLVVSFTYDLICRQMLQDRLGCVRAQFIRDVDGIRLTVYLDGARMKRNA